jgi:hypothetical protein
MTMSALPAAWALAALAMNLTPANAEDANPSSNNTTANNQSCEAQALARKLFGADKDSFIAKCKAEAASVERGCPGCQTLPR